MEKLNRCALSSPRKTVLRLLRDNNVDEARRVFAKVSSPDLRLYTMMINSFSHSGDIAEAVRLFTMMPARDVASWNAMLKVCLGSDDLRLARELFDEMPKRNVISWTTIIGGLSRCGRVEDAEELFCKMPERDTAAWNCMIYGYCYNGRLHDARLLFEEMPHRNVVSWTSLIDGYHQNGRSEEALYLFRLMLSIDGLPPTSNTFASVLTACAELLDLVLGTQLHAQLLKVGCSSNTYVSTSLMMLYSSCKQIQDSCKVFYEHGRDVVSWTALITSYGLNGKHTDSLNEFREMLSYGISPNESTFTSSLNSCLGLEALDCGRTIHARTIKQGFDDAFVANSLIVLYSKCGDIDNGVRIFDKMSKRNIVSWNSIIVGCAQNGRVLLALKYFSSMSDYDIQPDEVTYTGVLTGCSHARMLEKGKQIFDMMQKDPSFDLKLQHYVCMVDILGRSGKFEEAEEFIKNMGVEPNPTVWLSLLGSCRIHNKVEIARRTAQRIFDLDPFNSAAYVLLSNIYASAGRWNDVAQVRITMRSCGITKVRGSSWIILRGCRHEFVCGDQSHPMAKEIYEKLDWLSCKLEEVGYVYDKRFALHDVDDEQKEAALRYHSEKLAIAFGLLSSVEGSKITVFKNLRVCGDCHSAVKMISTIVGRDIVVRDSTRFHHIRGGLCSCDDFW